jgi:hypothetical protein
MPSRSRSPARLSEWETAAAREDHGGSLGKTRSETDAYALDTSPDAERPRIALTYGLREHVQEVVYTHQLTAEGAKLAVAVAREKSNKA